MSPHYAAFVVAASVAILLVLVLRLKTPGFLALLVVALGAGLAMGASPEATLDSIRNGMGGTLGFVGVVVGLGALFGAMLEASGGVKTVSDEFLRFFGEKRAGWALGAAGFVIAIPVFFDVAFIILAPLLYGLARKTGRSLVYFALPLLAGLVATHAFIPPTPGPVAVTELLGAEIGLVILFGALAGLPAMIVAGPLFAKLVYGNAKLDAETAMDTQSLALTTTEAIGKRQPVLAMALGITLLPLILVLAGALAAALSPAGFIRDTIVLLGHPFMALMIACVAAFVWLVLGLGATPAAAGRSAARALEPAGAIALITGAGGAFKEVLVDTGGGAAMAGALAEMGWPPLVFAFIAAAVVRLAQGSATVAMITAASLIAPLLAGQGLSPQMTALAVIAIASGATLGSHVNDSGFWLVSRYLFLTEAQTLRTWTVCSTLVGLTGMAGVLILSFIVN